MTIPNSFCTLISSCSSPLKAICAVRLSVALQVTHGINPYLSFPYRWRTAAATEPIAALIANGMQRYVYAVAFNSVSC